MAFANPCRFAGVVLEGIGEIVEVGRLVEHVQKSDRRRKAIETPPPNASGRGATVWHHGGTVVAPNEARIPDHRMAQAVVKDL